MSVYCVKVARQWSAIHLDSSKTVQKCMHRTSMHITGHDGIPLWLSLCLGRPLYERQVLYSWKTLLGPKQLAIFMTFEYLKLLNTFYLSIFHTVIHVYYQPQPVSHMGNYRTVTNKAQPYPPSLPAPSPHSTTTPPLQTYIKKNDVPFPPALPLG